MIKCASTCVTKGEAVCCQSCGEKETCNSVCTENPKDCGSAIFEEDNALEYFQNKNLEILEKIKFITTEKKILEEKEKELKAELEKAMTENNVKKFSNDFISISYVEPTTAESFDSKKFKEENPALAAKYIKTSKKSGYVKITIKEEK